MTKHTLRLCLFLLFVAISALSIQAQSGRRKAPPPPAAPIPTPTPEPTPIQQKQVDEKPTTGFVVGMDRGGAFVNYPISFYDVVHSACVERLRSESSAWVEAVREEMNRGQALKRAKTEPIGYVVLLQLSTTAMSNSTNQNYNDIEIEYTVFTAGTGKIATSGRGYQNANRKGPLVVSPPIGTNSQMVREQLLRLAAEDVANRILKSLHVTKYHLRP